MNFNVHFFHNKDGFHCITKINTNKASAWCDSIQHLYIVTSVTVALLFAGAANGEEGLPNYDVQSPDWPRLTRYDPS